jgi:hypothetical protein
MMNYKELKNKIIETFKQNTEYTCEYDEESGVYNFLRNTSSSDRIIITVSDDAVCLKLEKSEWTFKITFSMLFTLVKILNFVRNMFFIFLGGLAMYLIMR